MTRHIKRGGKVWINIYPDRPLTKKPAETRMGSGKGSPEWWVANVKPGRVHVRALRCAARRWLARPCACAIHKLPMKARIRASREVVSSDGSSVEGSRTRAAGRASTTSVDVEAKLREAKEELFNLRFQSATGQLENHGRLRAVKKDIARIYTVLRERELGIRADVAAPVAEAKEEEVQEGCQG